MMRTISKTVVMIALASAGGACSGDGGTEPARDAVELGPREAAEADECTIGRYGGEGGECLAQWACRTYGALVLACGSGFDAGVGCACIRGDMQPVIISVTPMACMDVAAMTEFARVNCGWSWL